MELANDGKKSTSSAWLNDVVSVFFLGALIRPSGCISHAFVNSSSGILTTWRAGSRRCLSFLVPRPLLALWFLQVTRSSGNRDTNWSNNGVPGWRSNGILHEELCIGILGGAPYRNTWVELRIGILSEVRKLLVLVLLVEECIRIDLDLSLEAAGWYPKNYFSLASGWKILL